MDQALKQWLTGRKSLLCFICIKKTWFTESVVKSSHDFWKLFQLNILKQTITMFYVLRHKLLVLHKYTKLFDVFKIGCWNNFQESWLVLTTDSVNHVFFMHMEYKKLILRLQFFHTWTSTWCHQQSLLEGRWLGSCSL